MAVKLSSYKIDEDGHIRVVHIFFGATEEDCEQLQEQHADGCMAYGPALDDGDTIDIFEYDAPFPDRGALETVEEAQGGEDEDDEADEEEDDE